MFIFTDLYLNFPFLINNVATSLPVSVLALAVLGGMVLVSRGELQLFSNHFFQIFQNMVYIHCCFETTLVIILVARSWYFML